MMSEDQILEFNRVAFDIGANPIEARENPETKEQEVSEIATEPQHDYGVKPDFELSEVVEAGIGWLGGQVEFTQDENAKISSATSKVLEHHNVNISNVHPYVNAALTTGFIVMKRKGGAFFKKINPFKKKQDAAAEDLTGERDQFGRIKL